MTTHSALWRRVVDEPYQRSGADSRMAAALVDKEDADGLGMADDGRDLGPDRRGCCDRIPGCPCGPDGEDAP